MHSHQNCRFTELQILCSDNIVQDVLLERAMNFLFLSVPRKSAWEIYALNSRTNPAATQNDADFFKNLSIKVKIGTIVSMTTPLLVSLFCYNFVEKVDSDWLPISGVISAMVALYGSLYWLTINNAVQSTKKVLKLKQEYDNAIAVKSFLMKSYAS